MTAGLVILVRCHYCSKQRSPREVINMGGAGAGGAVMCWVCYERHRKIVADVGAAFTRGCQECGVSLDALQAQSADGNAGLWVHFKDGIYQMLCPRCSEAYEKRRLDLYGDTAYGARKKLKGAK